MHWTISNKLWCFWLFRLKHSFIHIYSLRACFLCKNRGQTPDSCRDIKVWSSGPPQEPPFVVMLLLNEFSLFLVILSWLERSHQDLSEDVKSIVRKQELIKLNLSEVGLLLEFSKAYSPRSPKEVVAHRHYSPARLTVTACSTSGWVHFYYIRLVRNLKCWKNIDHLLACFHFAFPYFFFALFKTLQLVGSPYFTCVYFLSRHLWFYHLWELSDSIAVSCCATRFWSAIWCLTHLWPA